MFNKRILPEGFNFDVPSVEIVGCSSRTGLDKTAMLKRASAFEDVIADLKPQKGKTYLHVITTGAMEKYGSNRNGDSFNEESHEHTCPNPERKDKKTIKLGGGLKEYHDKSYMSKKAAVYQEHKTKDTDPSGYIVAAAYNKPMSRGELLICVDDDKWADRLQKKASGQNIYLSMGCQVPYDICTVCHRMAKTASEHCDHFKKMRCQIMDDGTQASVINDRPEFYDISGVDVPADRIAFVLSTVNSDPEANIKTASFEALDTLGTRPPMLLTKAASILKKLSKMEKEIEGMVEGDKDEDDDEDEEFDDDEEDEKDFALKVRNFPVDEIIDASNRKGILLSPGMFFKLLGKDLKNEAGESLMICDDDSCGDCSSIMRELEDDTDRNTTLLDGSFDQHFIPDLNLENILESFMPMFGMTNPAVTSRSIHIIITGKPKKEKKQKKEAAFTQVGKQALRQTYARYLISFAAQNDDSTCYNALRKVARYGK